jgi:hypothetical protein
MKKLTQRRPMWRWLNMVFGVFGVLLASAVCAPQLLAFPYHVDVGSTRVYAEAPLDVASLRPVLARADTLLATSPIYWEPVGTRIFLTNGGWRWRVLALTSHDTLAFTRPSSDLVSDAVIIHQGNVLRDEVSTPFGTRSLSGIIAHERTHIMVRRHMGLIASIRIPGWINEGYADYIASESTLSPAQAADLAARSEGGRASFYYAARRRVEAALSANGGDVDALLRDR